MGALALAGAGSVGAQARTAKGVQLSWDAPAGCPPAMYLHDRIRAVVGDQIVPDEPVEATIAVQQGGDGVWRLTLATRQRGVAGRRAFEADSCVAVAEAAALVIAMMIDPNARLDPPSAATPPAPTPPVPLPRASPRPASPRRGLVAAEPSPVKISLSPALMLDAGSLPTPTLGVGGAWRFRSRSLGVDFHGSWWPARRQPVPDRSSAGVEVGLVAAGVQGCAMLGAFVAEVRGCVGGEIGSLSVDAFGVSRTQAAHPFWGGLTAGLAAELPLGGAVSGWMQAGAVAPLTRPSVEVSPYGRAFRPGPIAVRAAMGLVYTF